MNHSGFSEVLVQREREWPVVGDTVRQLSSALTRTVKQVNNNHNGTNGDEPSRKIRMLFKLDNLSGPSNLSMPAQLSCQSVSSSSSSSSVTHVEESNPGSDDSTEQGPAAECSGGKYWHTAATPTADETPYREPLVFGKNSDRNIAELQQTISSTVVPVVPTLPFEYRSDDPWGAKMIQERVNIVLERWGSLNAIDPIEFFQKLLSSRGYSTDVILAPATRRWVVFLLDHCITPNQLTIFT